MSALTVRIDLKDKNLQNLVTVINNIKYNKSLSVTSASLQSLNSNVKIYNDGYSNSRI